MGNGIRITLAALALSCLLAGNSLAVEGTSVEGKNIGIEQVYLSLPDVYVYGNGLENTDARTAEGYLGETKLTFESVLPFRESGEGIYYYVLLDVSGSIPKAYFSSIKEGILNLEKGLGDRDKMILCTFGEDVRLLLDGTQDEASLKAALDALQNRDQRTLLFEGIDRVAEIASKVSMDECKRRVLVVISDGEDIAVGQKMSQEALANLKEKGIPAYALCIEDTDRSNINSFGEFARMSGGDIRTFRAEEGSGVLTQLHDRLYEYTELHLTGPTNVVSNRYESFSLHIPDQKETLTKEVMNARWIPDQTAPVITSAEQTGDHQIRIVFSEPVLGIETASNYSVNRDGTAILVSGVAYEKGNANTVVLTTENALSDGSYEITCTNITDASMEKNPISQSFSISLKGNKVEKQEPEDNTGIWFLLFLAVVALMIILLALYKKVKSHRGIIYVDGKPVLASNVEVKQHIAVQEAGKKKLYVSVSMAGKHPQKMEWEMERSLIVGRANLCDVFFDDTQMSRQHFCLELENGSLYITDLDTTNGTAVNGIGIHKKRKLEPGDVIDAGSMEIKVDGF